MHMYKVQYSTVQYVTEYDVVVCQIYSPAADGGRPAAARAQQ